MTVALEGWRESRFATQDLDRIVFRRGEGPAVIVVHEVPGITPTVLRFAHDVVDAGFTVFMPSLVGTPGRAPTPTYLGSSLLRVCIAREFTSWATGSTSTVVAWLRALARYAHGQVGGPGVGAVGMCFSGGFALGMMVDDLMVAPVLAQPSLPFAVGARRARDLGLSSDDRVVVAQRAADGCQVLGLRFTGDRLVGQRFEALRELLGDAFLAVELPSTTPSQHSVLTEHRDDAAVDQVLGFLRQRLQ